MKMVARCLGGPLDGKLARVAGSLIMYCPIMNREPGCRPWLTHVCYHLITDGVENLWLADES